MNANLKRSMEEKEKFNKQLEKRIKQVFGSVQHDFIDDCIVCRVWDYYKDLKYEIEKEVKE